MKISMDSPHTVWYSTRLEIHAHLPTLSLLSMAVGLSVITAWAVEMVPPTLLAWVFLSTSLNLVSSQTTPIFLSLDPHSVHVNGKFDLHTKMSPFYSKDNSLLLSCQFLTHFISTICSTVSSNYSMPHRHCARGSFPDEEDSQRAKLAVLPLCKWQWVLGVLPKTMFQTWGPMSREHCIWSHSEI